MTAAVLLASLALGCASDVGEVASDFSLDDVNPTSTTYDTAISPRQKLDKVSAWYFGHST